MHLPVGTAMLINFVTGPPLVQTWKQWASPSASWFRPTSTSGWRPARRPDPGRPWTRTAGSTRPKFIDSPTPRGRSTFLDKDGKKQLKPDHRSFFSVLQNAILVGFSDKQKMGRLKARMHGKKKIRPKSTFLERQKKHKSEFQKRKADKK